MIHAVIFDIGGPIDLETQFEAAVDADIKQALRDEGIVLDDDAYARAEAKAIEICAPSVYRSVIWQLTNGDEAKSRRVYDWMEARAAERSLFELRPGIPEVLAELNHRGFLLGLAANQPLAALEHLSNAGIGHFFVNKGIRGHYGLRKPDVRLFLRACEDLCVAPSECVMVGDRMDNDIVPAKLLGMRTVRIRTGRHRLQEPRSWDEIPDATVDDAAGVLDAIVRIAAGAAV